MNTLLFGDGAVSLDAVYPYGNISLAPEAVFDDLTRLAAYICQTPVALLSLLDSKSWWECTQQLGNAQRVSTFSSTSLPHVLDVPCWGIKSHVGIERDAADSYLALCTETLRQLESHNSSILTVQDTLADQRFAEHELVSSSQEVRFYTGVPLVTPQGLILGVLSVSDRTPRSLTLQQQQALLALSRQAISLITYSANVQLVLRNHFTNLDAMVNEAQQVVGQGLHQKLADIERVLEQPSMVAITNRRGKILYVNDKFCQVSQYSAKELIGVNHRLVNSSYHSSSFFKQMWTTIARGRVWRGEIRNRAKDGRFYWVETMIVPILNEQGKPGEYVSICQDMTQYKRTEGQEQQGKAITTSNWQENALSPMSHVPSTLPTLVQADRFFSLAPDMLCVVGLDGYFKCVNSAFFQTLAYTSEELLSNPFLDFVHPEDKAVTLAEWEKLNTNASVVSLENRYRCQDGSYKWLSWNYSGVEDGVVYAIARDITQSKQTEAALLERMHLSTLQAEVGVALRQSGTNKSSLQRCTEVMVQHLHAVGVGIWMVGPTGMGTGDVFPLSLQASAGQLSPIVSDDISCHPELINAIVQTRQPVTVELPTARDNSAPIGYLTGYPLMVESQLVGVLALLSHQLFSDTVRKSLGWVVNAIAIAIDRDQAKEERRERWEALVFWLARQIRSSSDLNTILDTTVAEIRNLMQVDCCHFLWCWSQRHQPRLSVTHEARNPALPSWLGEDPLPQFAPLEQSIRNLGRLRIDDLAETPDLEPETRSLLADLGLTSGLLLPLLTQTGQLGGVFCSHYNRPRRWNDEEVELLQAVVNQIAIAIEHAELFASTRAATLAAQTQARQLELTLHELQQAESLLIQSEKMCSLGQMVAGIAHEINNPVSFITGNLLHATNYIQDLLDLIERYQKHYSHPVPEIQDHIEEIDLEFLVEDLPKVLSSMQLGADRIHEIVLSLRNFSRTDEGEMTWVNVHEGIDSTLLILHNRLKPNGNNPGIKIVKEYGDLPPVECYAGQLYQVFMNIISNAIDAMDESVVNAQWSGASGKTTDNEQRTTDKTPTIWICTELVDGNQVLIRICDNGPGMTQCVTRRLFDPFFTTKPLGKGTGLGLSISHQIVVEKHNGVLQCFSEPGQGAEFRIQIPVASPVAPT